MFSIGIGRRSLWPVALLVIVLFCSVGVNAQDVANGQATATVLAVLTVVSSHDLDFGDVLQGVATVADKTVDAEAGVFEVTGEAGKEVAVHLQLPDYIALADGSDRMVISFSSTDADVDFTAAAAPSAHTGGAVVDQNPHNLGSININNAVAPDNNFKVFLGGTVFPTVDQAAGAYSGDIIMTAAYTGS